jgi:hypothetical protein
VSLALLLGLAAPAHAEPPSAQPLAPGALAKALLPPGTWLRGLRFQDRNGENLVIFTRAESARPARGARDPERSRHLYVRHYARASAAAAPRLLREVRDKVERCEFDPSAELLPDAIGVSDLDGDGIGELTFAYKLGCRSDVSPITLKLLLLEGGAKHILRGETRVKISPTERAGGKHTVDASFKRAPPAFLAHALRLWSKVVDERFE